MDFGKIDIAFANRDLDVFGGSNLAVSNHKSSLNSQNFNPWCKIFLAFYYFPSSSSILAAAIQPYGFLGLLLITDFIIFLTLSKSPISASVCTGIDDNSVNIPFLSTDLVPKTDSVCLSNFDCKIVILADPTSFKLAPP